MPSSSLASSGRSSISRRPGASRPISPTRHLRCHCPPVIAEDRMLIHDAPLHILYLEDDAADADILQEILVGDGIGCVVTRVESEGEFRQRLETGGVDLILADYTLPDFDGLSALQMTREIRPEVPFIFVSGTLGEERAIEALKIGATDYVLKTGLARVVPSVRRALRAAHEGRTLRRTEDALRRSEASLAYAQKLSHTGSFGWNVAHGRIYWSRETFRIFEYEFGDEITIQHVLQRTHPEDRPALQELIERVSRESGEFDFEHRLLMPDGSVKHLRVVGQRQPSPSDAAGLEFAGAVTDITEQKRAEVVRIAERTRIARELHDTLLQDFQGALLLFEAAHHSLPSRPVEARHALERALSRAQEA